ncbi:Transposon Tf2-6 poly [Paramuricea clavata]|uniref:Transposon Tf2-6 poly n=1 Tax=Paramuricea clavata TaxID=317549 RepID=A0A7D9HJW0_PARCT|nr:Transposon Tf2-6 poly [Paramuricea clavata]
MIDTRDIGPNTVTNQNAEYYKTIKTINVLRFPRIAKQVAQQSFPAMLGSPEVEGKDPTWTPSNLERADNRSYNALTNEDSVLQVFNDGMESIARASNTHFEPVIFQLQTTLSEATSYEKTECMRKAEEACAIVCKTIAPKDGENLLRVISPVRSESPPNEVLALLNAYKNAPTKNIKTQILSLYCYQYTTKKLKEMHEPFEKLSDRKIKLARSHAKTYEQHCKGEGFSPLSRASMYRVLQVREASQRKSLQGLDNIATDGSAAFHTLSRIVEDLEQTYGAEKAWSTQVLRGLKDGKRYLKTNYRVHCRNESSSCPDHCRTFALSDPGDPDFQAECSHSHNVSCESCENINQIMTSIEEQLTERANNMYTMEQLDDYKHDVAQALRFIHNWKAHILRAQQQEDSKTDVIKSLHRSSILIIMDWAMKFVQMRHREKQSDWFGKRGMNWHVCSVLSKSETNLLQIEYYVHLFNSCVQDWYSVVSILEQLLTSIKKERPEIQQVFIRSDEAGCYHNNNIAAAMRDIGERIGITVVRYDHSEPQYGKDICDRILCHLKGTIRRYCHEGNDIVTAADMYQALKERPIAASTAGVFCLNQKNRDLQVKNINAFGSLHNFRYETKGLRVWKAFGIGPGKLIPWHAIYIHHQSPTKLTIDGKKEFFLTTAKVVKSSANTKPDEQPNKDNEDVLLFECQEVGCEQSFENLNDLEVHISLEKHNTTKENIYDSLRREWVSQFNSIRIEEQSTPEDKEKRVRKFHTSLEKGWALHQVSTRKRFSKEIRVYLTENYDVGEKTGCKLNPGQVARDMRTAKDEAGLRKFKREEWLTKSQIQSFFSRITANRRKQTGQVEEDEDGVSDEEHLAYSEDLIYEECMQEQQKLKANLELHEIDPLLISKFKENSFLGKGTFGFVALKDSLLHAVHDALAREDNSSLPWTTLMEECCSALSYLHNAGYLHNDIKSDNLLLTKSSSNSEEKSIRMILNDLGKATLITEGKLYNLTPTDKEKYYKFHNHIAPDVIEGEAPQSIKSDTFSLGIVFYDVAKAVKDDELRKLTKSCTRSNPSLRCDLHDLVVKIRAYLNKL